MEERIQNLLSSLEAIKSNSALETQDYEMKPEEKSKITDELKAIQTDLEKSVDEFAVSFNLNLESSTIPTESQEQEQQEQQEEPQEEPQEQQEQQPPTQEQPPPQGGEDGMEEGDMGDEGMGDEDGMGEDDMGEGGMGEEDEELMGGNIKQKTKKNKRRSRKSTQKKRKNN